MSSYRKIAQSQKKEATFKTREKQTKIIKKFQGIEP
jgi:hypothetical protein